MIALIGQYLFCIGGGFILLCLGFLVVAPILLCLGETFQTGDYFTSFGILMWFFIIIGILLMCLGGK